MLRSRFGLVAFLLILLFALPYCSENNGAGGGNGVGEGSPTPAVSGDLTFAVAKNDVIAMQTHLNAGADINENIGGPVDQVTPLMVALVLGHTTIAKYLIVNGAQLYPTFFGYASEDLAYQLYSEDSEVVKMIETRSEW